MRKVIKYISPLFIALILTGCGKKIHNTDAILNASVDQAINNAKWSKSMKLAKEAMNQNPQYTDAQVMYSICENKLGNNKEAVKQLKNALLVNPSDFLAQYALGSVLYSSGKYSDAYTYLGNAYNSNPNDPGLTLLYAETAGKLQANNATDLYLKVIDFPQYTNSVEVYNNLGVCATYSNNYRLALEALTKAYKIDQSNPTVVGNLAVLKDRYLKEKKQAKFFYRSFISLTNGNSAFKSQRESYSARLKDLR